MVINHAVKMSAATPQRTLPNLSEAPMPIIAELTTCDVLTGNPTAEAERMTSPDVNWVVKL